MRTGPIGARRPQLRAAAAVPLEEDLAAVVRPPRVEDVDPHAVQDRVIGRAGHNGGIVSYSAGGKQYVAVMTGWGSLVGDEYPALFGEPFTSMPKDTGALVVFALP